MKIRHPDEVIDFLFSCSTHLLLENNESWYFLPIMYRKTKEENVVDQYNMDSLPDHLTNFLLKNREWATKLFGVEFLNRIHDHGYWTTEDAEHHVFDGKLCSAIISVFEGVSSSVDIGCGSGEYVKQMIEADIECYGYDGNPNTKEITGGICDVLDFAEPVDIGKFELVVSLEIGEHIPRDYEQIFLDNITNASSKYIVLSWGIPGQLGWGHVNCRTNEYIIGELENRGFKYDNKTSEYLRNEAEFSWFKQTILCFQRM